MLESDDTLHPQTLATKQTHLRDTADAKTHPSRNFHLPRSAPRDAAHAHELLGVYCARMCDWVLATFDAASPEATLLRTLRTFYVASHPRNYDAGAYTQVMFDSDYGSCAFGVQTSLTRILDCYTLVMLIRKHVREFHTSFEVHGQIYNLTQVVRCLQENAIGKSMRMDFSLERQRSISYPPDIKSNILSK
jgi:hypothetical protein